MISVIVPVYNVEKYLCKCLESIANQTFTDFELIIVDDGSTDSCPAIIEDFVNLHKDIIIKKCRLKNSGLSYARNKGITLSQGEYISFVDSDDFLEPDMLMDLYKTACDTAADIVSGFHNRCDSYNVNKTKKSEVLLFDTMDFLKSSFQIHGNDYTNSIAVWGKLYRRYIWEVIRFPEGKVFEDEMIFHKVMSTAKKIAVVDYPYYHYIKRSGSIVNAYNYSSLIDKADAFRERALYLSNYDYALASSAALKFYAHCVDSFITLSRLEPEKCRELLEYFLTHRKVFFKYLPWHQKCCVIALLTRRLLVLHYLAKCKFAPGRSLFQKQD